VVCFAFSDTFLPAKINFFYYFLHTEKETKECSLHHGVYLHHGSTCTVDLSHILKFSCKLHFKCISAYIYCIILHLNCTQLHQSIMASSSPPPLRSYQNTLVSLPSFLDGHKYHKDTVFSPDRLSAITADDIIKWMNLKAFGSINPSPDANPTGCHSSTILFWKKSISFFIPNKHHPWDSLLCRGNPTRSREVLDLIKYIKKKEVR
jgi:hypothetical protein